MTDNAELMRRSWRSNAQAWTAAVRGGLIASRRSATNDAIVNAVVDLKPNRVLDVGCGEGWLCRALAAVGITAVGIDAAPELLAVARQSGGGEYYLAAYDEIPGLQPGLGRFAAVVCNFSLLEEVLGPALCNLKKCLEPAGRIVIQTQHPWRSAGEDYRDGWRVESFAGFGAQFSQPMPWYFRSLSSWVALLTDNGFYLERIAEPLDPQSGAALSLLLQCKLNDS